MVGRPKDRAPNGHMTVREAAETLGVSDQAVRARLERGTLPDRTELTESGEVRHYIPREAVAEALRHRREIATRADADEIHVAAAMLTNEIVGEIKQNRAEITRRMDDATGLMREMAEREKAYQEQAMVMLDQEQKRHERISAEVRRWRIMAYVALACLVLIATVILLDQIGII